MSFMVKSLFYFFFITNDMHFIINHIPQDLLTVRGTEVFSLNKLRVKAEKCDIVICYPIVSETFSGANRFRE